MKVLKILLCAAFVFIFSSCGGKKDDPYDYPDEGKTPGEIGDPCMKKGDCRDGLVCIARKCKEPAEDNDKNDDDPDTGTNDGDTDSDTPDDSDTDTGTSDGDTDTNTHDDEDTGDSKPDDDADSDEPVYTPECGNGIQDPGEECDYGLENSDEPGILEITCRTNCYFARCGDGIPDSSEACDDGNFASGDYCSPDCNIVTGRCGDGIRQNNEKCESAIDPYCSEDCSEVTGSCGDGIKQDFEACDNAEPSVGKGEGIGPYYCNRSCSEITGRCGDSIRQLNEKCDHGDNNGRYGYCNLTCSGLGERCGDGVKQMNEACDDGNTVDGDYCSKDCQESFGSCGDAILQDFEACDKALTGDGTYCSDDCMSIAGRCGDGHIDSKYGETCDNGVGANGREDCEYGSALGCETCSLTCRKTSGKPRYCGDGVITVPYEECDKANFGDGIGVYCSNDCKNILGRCGDGTKQEFEACDKAEPSVGKGEGIGNSCSEDCKEIIGHCGDGKVQSNEECDYGADNGKPDCPYGVTTCKVCTDSCKEIDGNASYCGNSKTEKAYGEECDDGRNNGHYGYCKSDCSEPGERCGDGKIQRTDCAGYDNCFTLDEDEVEEECDFGSGNGVTECPYGQKTCKVCTALCKKIDGQPTAYCGDGKIQRKNCDGYGSNCVVSEEANETCDDGENNGKHGYCPLDCRGEGERCGDHEVNGDEICDEGDGVNGTYGHCNADCSGPGEHCGDGIINGNEICDDGENNGKYKRESPGHCNEDCMGYGEGGYCGDEQQNGNETCDYGEENNGKTECPYGETSCTVCNSSCKLTSGETSYCGDGKINQKNGETCDDGRYNSEYGGNCKPDCKGTSPKCGDETVDTEFGEICDEGSNNNGFYYLNKPGHCNSDCKGYGSAGYCGDHKVNGDERCDDGDDNGKYGNYCNSTCTGRTPYCGDGVIDKNEGEVCDDGLNNGSYGFCNDGCTAKIECGDGIIQREDCAGHDHCVVTDGVNEECDDGYDVNGVITCPYGEKTCTICNAACRLISVNTSYCGDGIIQREDCTGKDNCVVTEGINEDCDDGENNGHYGYCDNSCTASMPKCGDGTIQREDCTGYDHCDVTAGVNEDCDDGKNNGTYGKCNPKCTGIMECGDGEINGNEKCDSGLFNDTYGQCNSSCTATTGYCGDGKIQRTDCSGYENENCFTLTGGEEECDNGYMNGKITDCIYGETCLVCSGECKNTAGRTAYCGDGRIQKGSAAQCADYVAEDPENRRLCGEGVTENCCEVVAGANEVCDDGDGLNGTPRHCNLKCNAPEPYCGDGKIDRNYGEVCDDGDGLNGQIGNCSLTCKGPTPYCGDGITQRENCGALDLCTENVTTNCCKVVEGMNEECDHGSLNNTPGYCYSDCSGYCGDGSVQDGHEVCDEGNGVNGLNGQIGHCSVTCNGPTPFCGDGRTQRADCGSRPLCDENVTTNCCEVVAGMKEICDDGNDNGKYGKCDSLCKGNKAEGGWCGDGKVQKSDPANCGELPLCGGNIYINCCEIKEFAEGDADEFCDEEYGNGYHGHCNKTCSGTSVCGDGEIGFDELCEPGPINKEVICGIMPQLCENGLMEGDFTCSMLPQFTGSGIISSCDSNCMFVLDECEDNDSYRSPFLATGQTKCYGNSEEIDPCPASGENFYGQERNFKYTPHDYDLIENDKIIIDYATGLMWETVTPQYYGFEEEGEIEYVCEDESSCTIDEAFDYCNSLVIGDFWWTLPTAAEFSTIMDYASDTHLYSDFENSKDSYLTIDGIVFSTSDGTSSPSTEKARVKCVSHVDESNFTCTSAQCMDAFIFVFDFSDSIITIYDIDETIFNLWYFGNEPMTPKTWKDALDFCSNADNNNGFNKMRLPTVNELMSIIDRINGGSLIPRVLDHPVWTSTTFNGNISKAYAVDFETGSVILGSKTDDNYFVICVE